ncbi:transcription factor SUA7 [Sporobolomyces koalae]|uniref:transcription factor SUA7 n=1 Tax=Sporobolomyces koalae TaxID=500713 RepID=UPI00317C0FF8
MATPTAFALKLDPAAAAALAAQKAAEFHQDLNVRLTCPDCKDDTELLEEYSSGDLVCGNCGLVLGDKVVDTRSEWRSFADSEGDDPSRVGGPQDPLLDPSEQLTTVISFKDNNTGVARALQMAASRVTRDSQNVSNRDLPGAYAQISTMCETISLPKSIIDTTKMLFKRCDEEKLLRGKKQEAVIGACIFVACKQGRVGRTFKELMTLTGVDKKQITDCFKVIQKSFETMTPHAAPSTDLDSLITRYCNHLGLSVPMQRACALTGNKVVEEGILAGRSPITIASSCILFVTTLFGSRIDPRKISEVAGVQDSTIRTGYRLLLPYKAKLVDQRWFDESRKEKADWNRIGGDPNAASSTTASDGSSTSPSTPTATNEVKPE